ncbi:4220_t:CDS:1 [Funneliformis caledonium]|uniref:4220_t:CDS:1 n=1 Tax=Funneliformis caledonium TaxID=1117310 RepID=A0A9N9BLB6_9GLOM|nr:4220_t:CDS:1 [Funneliformis caledonium]
MVLIVPDKRLFTIILFIAFANNDFMPSFREIWNSPWVTGTAAAAAIGLTGLVVAPFILSAIISALGFGTEGIAASSFGSWFMSLYGGIVESGSVLSILQSYGAAGLPMVATYISGSVGTAIGILIGAAGGNMLANYLDEMKLNEPEQQSFENFVQIEEKTFSNDHSMVIFTLLPALLCNQIMLKCFIETFVSISPFSNSKSFKFYFNEKSSSEEEKLHIIYDLLISNFNESRVESLLIKDQIVGYGLDLNDYQASNVMIYILEEIWRQINVKGDIKSKIYSKISKIHKIHKI